MRRLFPTSWAATVLSVVAFHAEAQSPNVPQPGNVHGKLVNQAQYIAQQGGEIISETIDRLIAADRKKLPFNLASGFAYAFVGACGANCDHIEISLFDNKAKQLARSPEKSDTVIVGGPATYTVYRRV